VCFGECSGQGGGCGVCKFGGGEERAGSVFNARDDGAVDVVDEALYVVGAEVVLVVQCGEPLCNLCLYLVVDAGDLPFKELCLG